MAITNTALATAMSDLIAHWQDFQDEHVAWLAGTVGGGPNLDGEYPLTDYLDNTVLVKCPAQLEDDVTSLVTGAQGYATAAAASAAAAATAETNAETAETNAETAETNAVTAKDAALAAQTAAESARATAIAQAAAASASATAAATAQAAAELAEANAEAAAGSVTDPGANAVMTWDDTGNTPAWATTLPAVNGSALTNLNATNLASGTVADARLSSNVALYDAATATFTGGTLELSSTLPILRWKDSDAGTNEKNWLWYASGTQMILATATDASPGAAASSIITVTRSGSSPTSISLATTLNINGSGSRTINVTGNGGTPGSAGLQIQHNSDGNVYFWNYSNSAILFGTNNATRMFIPAAGIGNYADDAAASAGGVGVGGIYRNGSVLMIRVS